MPYLLLLLFGVLIQSVTAVLPTVNLGCNTYAGVTTPYGITQWLGMRYAAPPTGQLRFSPPADPPCTDVTQAATDHGKVCLGTGDPPNRTETAEDCLFIDVYAPTNASTHSKLPVFFHIQGGGFNGNTSPNINGRGLITASNYSMVFVTFNYRVGPYGFITDGNNIKANNGLRDQRKALHWVQDNIEKFGGDPGHVVLGGESAGAASISLQMTAYGGKDFGLFHAAAAESVSFGTVLTVNESQYQYNNFAIRLGCAGSDSLACLRSKTAQELQAANRNFPLPGASGPPLYMWTAAIDYDILSDLTYDSFAKGNFIKIPVIFGDDTNGGTVFAPQNASTLGDSNEFLHNQFPFLTFDQLSTLNELYPNPNETCPNAGCYWRQASNVYGDMRYMCPSLYISSAMTKYGVSQSWAYRYNVEDPTQVAQGLGVPHTVETYAIYGPNNQNSSAPASYYSNGTNAMASPVMQGYWTSFIRSFDPNKFRYPSSAYWDEWTPEDQDRLVIQTGGLTEMETVDSGLQSRCEYFYDIGLDVRQ